MSDARVEELLSHGSVGVLQHEQLTVIVEIHRLSGVGEEDGVLVRVSRLEQFESVVAFGDAVWEILLGRVIKAINFLPQNRPLERPARLARFVGRQAERLPRAVAKANLLRQQRVVQQHRLEMPGVKARHPLRRCPTPSSIRARTDR